MFKAKTSKTVWDKFPQLKDIPAEKFPKHLLLIPDGNGRWAQLLHKNVNEGHKVGAKVISDIYEDLWQLPIKYITIWGFSADNWSRTKEEAEGIMKIIDGTLKSMLPVAIERKSKIVHIGRKDRIPEFLKQTFELAEGKTKKNTKSYLSLAVDFGGEDQMVRMMQKIVKDKVKKITPETLIEYRDGGGEIPPADLIIRTSGERRTSDLGWLSENSELSFIKKLLPNIGSKDIVEAIVDYTKRKRRFGGRPIAPKQV